LIAAWLQVSDMRAYVGYIPLCAPVEACLAVLARAVVVTAVHPGVASAIVAALVHATTAWRTHG